VVIFNYKAESSTYIIAITGIAIWFFSQTKTRLNLLLIGLTFIFTILSPGDIFPHFIKEFFARMPYLKVVFPILIFGVVICGLFTRNFVMDELSLQTSHQ